MTNRENFLSLLRRQGYERVPVEFVLSPYQQEVCRKELGAKDYEAYFGMPWRRAEDLRLRDQDVEKFRKYYRKPLAEGADIDLFGVGHEKSPNSMHMTYMLISFIVFGFILAKTKFGRSVYAIGGSAEAARLAGLNPKRIVTLCFILIGLLTSMGGMIFAARMNAGQPAANVNLEFDAITAVILGGVSFAGGVGGMFGTVLGVFLIQAFNTGLIMVNVPTFWQNVAKGALLLFALSFDYIRKERREKELIAASKKNA